MPLKWNDWARKTKKLKLLMFWSAGTSWIFFCKCLNKMNWEFKSWTFYRENSNLEHSTGENLNLDHSTGENSILEHSTGENEDEIPCCCFLERKHWSCISTVSISNALHSAPHCTEPCTLHWKNCISAQLLQIKGTAPISSLSSPPTGSFSFSYSSSSSSSFSKASSSSWAISSSALSSFHLPIILPPLSCQIQVISN